MATANAMKVHLAPIIRRWPEVIVESPSGILVITIPNMPLPPDVYRGVVTTAVVFQIPTDFPRVAPEHFETDDLRLVNGMQPPWTITTPQKRLWWSHRIIFWDSTRDSLQGYLGSITRRLGNPLGDRDG